MSTSNPNTLNYTKIDDALSVLPKKLRKQLISYYMEMKTAYLCGNYDTCGVRAGKFSEILIRCLQQLIEGHYSPLADRLDVYKESQRLGRLPKSDDNESLRLLIPRAIGFLYTLRNKRGFAHAGEALDSEPIDASICAHIAGWCLCELIRVVHGLTLEDAQALVNMISEREIPYVWSTGGKKRILREGLSYRDQTLLLLYAEGNIFISVKDIFDWVEYSRLDNFRARILKPLHQIRLIEWNKDKDTVTISPTGIKEVEDRILNTKNVNLYSD